MCWFCNKSSPIHFHWNLLCQNFFEFYLWYWFIDKLITQIWISCMKYIIIEYKRKRLKWDTKYIFKFYSRFVTAKMICNKIWHMRQMLYLTIFQSRNNVFHSNWKYYFMMRFPCILICIHVIRSLCKPCIEIKYIFEFDLILYHYCVKQSVFNCKKKRRYMIYSPRLCRMNLFETGCLRNWWKVVPPTTSHLPEITG